MKFINLSVFILLLLTACNLSNEGQATGNTTTPKVNQKEVDAKIIADYVKENNLEGKYTDSGIFYQIEKQGEGASAKKIVDFAPIKAHYEGRLLSGKVFDSSKKRGKPLEFKLNQVIPGWNEAIRMLNVGGKGTFIIPSELAYGRKGFSNLIPGNAVLIFEIELVEV
ncbi:MAG: FKBP-type peptidyl-prolyl cis-trans isomerase [Saprospiraceae bacterium]